MVSFIRLLIATIWCYFSVISDNSPVIELSMNCHMAYMNATFKANVPNITGITNRILTYSLKDANCTSSTNASGLVGTSTEYFELEMMLDYNVDMCGSDVVSDTDSITVSNTVILKISDVLRTVSNRDYFFRYNLICNTTRNYTLDTDGQSINVTVEEGSVVPVNKPNPPSPIVPPNGLLQPTCFYTDSTFTTCANEDTVLSIPANQDIFMQVAAPYPDLSSVYKTIVSKCQAQNAPTNPTVVDVFLENNCPLDPTFQIIQGQSTNSKVSFQFKPFSFDPSLNAGDGMYLACDALLCLSSDVSAKCTQQCASGSRRKRRGAVENISDIGNNAPKGFTITSGKIRLNTELTCKYVRCGTNAKCHDLKPARCICDVGYVMSKSEKKCKKERLVSVKNIHLNQKWTDKLYDISSREFHNFVSMYEEVLYKSFMATKVTHVLEGVRIVKFTKGSFNSVILEVLLLHSSTSSYLEAYTAFVHSINAKSLIASTVRNHLKLMADKTPELQKAPTPTKVEFKHLIIVIVLVIFLFFVLIASVVFMMKKRRRNRKNNRRVVSFTNHGAVME